MKYWQALLLNWRKIGHDGLTIPYLIGSQQFLNNRNEKQDIQTLITEVATSKMFETCIRYCMNIETLILEIRKPSNQVYYPKYEKSDQPNLSIAIGIKDSMGDSLEDVIYSLTNQFQVPIERSLFSVKKNASREAEWYRFSESDEKFILDAFKNFEYGI